MDEEDHNMHESTILLVGVGGIGFRHFQSLTEIRVKAKLILVDINQEALNNAEEYYKTISNDNITIEYSTTINSFSENIDLAIIASSSLARRSIIEEILQKATVSYMVLEKFLFPKKEDFLAIGSLLEEHNIKTYVNCPRRMNPGFVKLKERLQGKAHIDVFVTGSQWGLSCNAIHAIDIIDYIIDASAEILSCTGALLDKKIIESKRKNYVEFTGSIIGNIGSKANFLIESMDSGEKPLCIYIMTDDTTYLISETAQRLDIIDNAGHSGIQQIEFPTVYQSRLTSLVAESLIHTGTCDLTTYDRSCELHLPLLNIFLQKINEEKEEQTDLCPIT
jgi:predicted dehydrogenase